LAPLICVHYKMMKKIPLFLCCFGLLFSAITTHAQSWKQWRGNDFNGSSTITNLPIVWSADVNNYWQIKLPGRGGGTPIISNTNIFIASTGSYGRQLLINIGMRKGYVVWEKELIRHHQKDSPFTLEKNCLSESSPITDGKTVWLLAGTGDLVAFNYDEDRLWSTNIYTQMGFATNKFLCTGTPLLLSNKLYLPVLQENKENPDKKSSSLACLDASNGNLLWTQPRTEQDKSRLHGNYASVIPYRFEDEVPRLIVTDSGLITAHNPLDGKELWRYEDKDLSQSGDCSTGSSAVPATDLGLVFVQNDKTGKCVAISVKTAKDTVREEDLAWVYQGKSSRLNPNIPNINTPLYYKERLYLLEYEKDSPFITCLDGKSGKTIWQYKYPAAEAITASLTGSDNKIYGITEKGNVFILQAGDECKELGINKMTGENVHASIAVANERMFIRTDNELFCVKVREWIRFGEQLFYN